MLLVQCNGCKKTAFAQDGEHRNPDAALECDCCAEDHDHAENANAGGEPCRPVTITLVPGQVTLQRTEG